MKTAILVLIALVLSGLVGYSDLSQTDTPITVTLILVASCIMGCLVSHKAWAYALIIGLGVPVAGLLAASLHWQLAGMDHGQIKTGAYPYVWVGVVTILLALFGAYVGQGLRRLFHPIKVY